MEIKIDDSDLMIWLDMETTGLSADNDVPLELGIVLTDITGTIVKAEKSLLVYEQTAHYEDCIELAVGNSIVNKMHTDSGLWDNLRTFSEECSTRSETDQFFVEWLKSLGVQERVHPMCGSSIGSLDRPFALKHFPKLNEFLSYRNIDNSTLKEVCRRVNPELYAQLPRFESNHRVVEDCKASAREYNWYLDNFLHHNIGEF